MAVAIADVHRCCCESSCGSFYLFPEVSLLYLDHFDQDVNMEDISAENKSIIKDLTEARASWRLDYSPVEVGYMTGVALWCPTV
eukprot:scaffold541978_cov50-Prasinocladus_malaysianus.AAC.1